MYKTIAKVGKKMVGGISDGCFFKNVKKRMHFLRMYSGYAISTDILNGLISKNIEWIFIHELEDNIFYAASPQDFLKFGTEIQFKKFDKQIVLNLSHFTEMDFRDW
jgi:hypothetical protein